MATAGPNLAGTGADNATVGTRTWINTGNITANDGTYTNTSVAVNSNTNGSHYLKATNFGFSIPSGATIDGITVVFRRMATPIPAKDSQVKIVKGGTIGSTSLHSGTNWDGTAFRSDTYGGATNLWGETWTHTDINSSTFGVVLSCLSSSFKQTTTPRVDYVEITINYTSGGVSFIARRNPLPMQAVNRAANF